jgi:hypothetical protein
MKLRGKLEALTMEVLGFLEKGVVVRERESQILS